METEQLSLLQQLAAQVQALYDSAPGTAPQREADKWLTSLVGLDAAWPVLLHVVGPGAGAGQASPFDVRLTFIAAKITQVRTSGSHFSKCVWGAASPTHSHSHSHAHAHAHAHARETPAQDPAGLAQLSPRDPADGAGRARHPFAAAGLRVRL